MRYIILITYLFFLSVSFGQSNYESGVIEFGVDLNNLIFEKIENTKENGDYNRQALNFVERLYLSHKKIYASNITFLELKFNNNTYVLKPLDIMLPENLRSKFILRSDIFYGDTNNNIFVKQFKKRGNTYLASFKKGYNWVIKNQEKKILGFKCRKAILKLSKDNQVVAWFAPQIPVAFSPVKYYGLPGAILEITTPSKHIYAKNIEFKEDVKVEKPTDGIKISQEEYKAMMTRFKPPDDK